MSPLVAALLMVGLVVGAWFGGRTLETWLTGPYAPPLVRRMAYGLLALAMVRGFLAVVSP